MAGLRFAALVRLHRHVAAGLHTAALFFNHQSRESINYAVVAGGEARFIMPLEDRISLWSSLAVAYIHYRYRDPPADHRDERQMGVGLGWGIGAHYTVARYVALGLNFWLYAPFFLKRCAQDDTSDATCGSAEIDNPARDFGIPWILSASVVVYLSP